MSIKNILIEKFLSEISSSPEMRTQFIKDPKSFIESRLNFKIPDNFEIMVHQDTPKLINIVLPLDPEELSEIELSAIAGGVCWVDTPECTTLLSDLCPNY